MPPATLFYYPVLISAGVSIMIQAVFQTFFFVNIRRAPFYTPLDPQSLTWDGPNLNYEDTVLFMVSNFQYVVTCLSFSIAEPYRLPIWSNLPYFLSIITAFAINLMIVFWPDGGWPSHVFNLLPFAKDGTNYYEYRYMVGIVTLANCIITYGAEKFIVNVLTPKADAKKKIAKELEFRTRMELYRNQVRGKEHIFMDRDDELEFDLNFPQT